MGLFERGPLGEMVVHPGGSGIISFLYCAAHLNGALWGLLATGPGTDSYGAYNRESTRVQIRHSGSWVLLPIG